MLATARDFVTASMKMALVLGVGQTLLAEDTNDGFDALKNMLAQWQKRRWLVPYLTDVVALGNSQQWNTIGPGGHFDTPIRPDKIQSAWVVQLQTGGGNPVSLPIEILMAYEDYALISVKELNTLPNYAFYDNSFANGVGRIAIWPIPDAQYQIHLLVKGALGWPKTLDSVFQMPDEYKECVILNLACRLHVMYGTPIPPDLKGLAKVALNTIKNSNAQVPLLQMPASLTQGPAFNIYNADGY